MESRNQDAIDSKNELKYPENLITDLLAESTKREQTRKKSFKTNTNKKCLKDIRFDENIDENREYKSQIREP